MIVGKIPDALETGITFKLSRLRLLSSSVKSFLLCMLKKNNKTHYLELACTWWLSSVLWNIVENIKYFLMCEVHYLCLKILNMFKKVDKWGKFLWKSSVNLSEKVWLGQWLCKKVTSSCEFSDLTEKWPWSSSTVGTAWLLFSIYGGSWFKHQSVISLGNRPIAVQVM